MHINSAIITLMNGIKQTRGDTLQIEKLTNFL